MNRSVLLHWRYFMFHQIPREVHCLNNIIMFLYSSRRNICSMGKKRLPCKQQVNILIAYVYLEVQKMHIDALRNIWNNALALTIIYIQSRQANTTLEIASHRCRYIQHAVAFSQLHTTHRSVITQHALMLTQFYLAHRPANATSHKIL